MVVGFIGVAVLVGFDPGVLAGTDVMAALALIGSSISYAAGGVYARRFAHGLRPMIPAVVQVAFALLYDRGPGAHLRVADRFPVAL